jgi:hypothetical protein
MCVPPPQGSKYLGSSVSRSLEVLRYAALRQPLCMCSMKAELFGDGGGFRPLRSTSFLPSINGREPKRLTPNYGIIRSHYSSPGRARARKSNLLWLCKLPRYAPIWEYMHGCSRRCWSFHALMGGAVQRRELATISTWNRRVSEALYSTYLAYK